MAEIIPAILPTSYAELEEKIDLIALDAPVVQIDVCDGGYVPSRTWPYLKGNKGQDDIFDALIDQSKAFPHWEDVDLEFDLMVRDVYQKIPDFISAGAATIIVHKASVSDEELESILRDYGKHSEELGMFDIELGLAIGHDADAASIAPFIDKIHFVQVMGINRIGYQGETFNPRAVELVSALRQMYPNLIISVDGGVNLDTGKLLVDAGADRLVVGSALFASDNVMETLESFRSL